MSDLTSFTDEDLKNEVLRREKARELEELQAKKNYAKKMSGLTMEMVDLIAPTHGRTSCSDTQYGNGWGSGEYGPRCIRCALVETVRGFWDSDFHLEVTICRR